MFAKSQACALNAGSSFLSSLGLLQNKTAQMLAQMCGFFAEISPAPSCLGPPGLRADHHSRGGLAP